jgi:hypothetical protein
VITRKMFRGVAVVQAFQSEGNKLQLAEDQISLVVVDKL